MFVPLHVKSDYSLGYGTASINELVERAASLDYSTLALTDLENLYGQVRFHHQCRRRGIRPIIGLELRPGFNGRGDFGKRAGRLVLLATDRSGYQSLCRIVSRRRDAAGPRQSERLGEDPMSTVPSHSQGLFALSDDPSVIQKLIAIGGFSREHLGLLLVRPERSGMTGSQINAANGLRVPLVADLDPVFLEQKDYRLHLLQIAVRQKRRLAEVENGPDAEDRNRWLRSPSEVIDLFADIPEALANTEAIANSCQFDLNLGLAEFPSLDLSSGVSADETLERICEEALVSRRDVTEVGFESRRERLSKELETFKRLGLSGFILIVAEILVYCRNKKIPVAARGSAVSSLTLHLLGASPVDPVSHGLLFERFLHAGKSSWPDIDLDLPWHRRDEVIDWVYHRFGHERVAMVAAHHTFQRRSALREGLKAWGLPSALIERLSRALPPEDLPVEEFDFLGLTDPVQEDFISTGQVEPGVKKMLEEVLPLVQRLIGRPHHVAAHPGGMVIGNRPLQELMPLERAPKGVVITQYDLTALDQLGFVKVDLLGNRCLSEIEETLELAADQEHRRMEEIPVEDAVTLDLIDSAETIGCFQLESPAMRSLLSRVPIRKHNDLITALALIRPGAAAGEAKASFIRRARGEEPDELLDPIMADRLGETHGMLIYEEDIMLLLSRLGGLSLGEADELRGAIVRSGGDPEVLEKLESDFLKRAQDFLGRDADSFVRARRGWAAAARFAAYSFNKAHAVSYGQLAYLSAYMKKHHLPEFSCALLNHHQGLYPLRTLASDLSRGGVEFRVPHVNASDYHSVLERNGNGFACSVRVGLDKLKGLSIRAAGDLIEERNATGPFSTLHDLLKRVRLSRTELAALILSGACDGLPPLAREDYPFMHEAALKLLKEEGASADLKKLQFRKRPENSEDVWLYQALIRVQNELRYFQMHLSAHPMALLRGEAARFGCVTIREATEMGKDSEVRMSTTLAAMRRVRTRQGVIQFLTLEDETGILEAVLLPPAYRRVGESVTTPGPFLVYGKLRNQQGAVYVEVTELSPFYQRKHPFSRL